jgi:hypothetical protein
MGDIYDNGPKIWDFGFDVALIVDEAIQISEQAEQEAVLVRARREIEIETVSFDCSCKCLAYLQLVTNPNYIGVPVEQADIEKLAPVFKSKCRLHAHDVLEYVNAARAADGLNPISKNGKTIDEKEEVTYKIVRCRLVNHDNGSVTHTAKCCLSNANLPKSLVELGPLALMSNNEEATTTFMENVVHYNSSTGSPKRNINLGSTTLAFSAIQVWHGLSPNLSCDHCRPHLSIMMRHWMRKLSVSSNSLSSTATQREVTTALKLLSHKHAALSAHLRSETPFEPLIDLVKPDLDKKYKRLCTATDGDSPHIDTTHVAENTGARVPPLTSHIVAMKNAVNVIKAETKHPAGVSTMSDFHWAHTVERKRLYGTLSSPEAFWPIIIQISLDLPDSLEKGHIDYPASAKTMVEDRQEWLKNIKTPTHKQTIFTEALASEADDDVSWRFNETAAAARSGFMAMLAQATLVFANSNTAYSSLVHYFWPIPEEVINHKLRRTMWLVERRWHWYCLKRGGNPMDLINQTYAGVTMKPFSANNGPLALNLDAIAAWTRILKANPLRKKASRLLSAHHELANSKDDDEFDVLFFAYLGETVQMYQM